MTDDVITHFVGRQWPTLSARVARPLTALKHVYGNTARLICLARDSFYFTGAFCHCMHCLFHLVLTALNTY